MNYNNDAPPNRCGLPDDCTHPHCICPRERGEEDDDEEEGGD